MSNCDNFNELNRNIEDSPKAMGCIKLFLKIVSIFFILSGILLCLAKPISGVIVTFIGGLIFWLTRGMKFKHLKELPWEEEFTAFEFPQIDKNGHRILTVYDMNVTGVMKNQNGINPQGIIPKLRQGEQIILEADPNNQYDNCAVKVKTLNNIQIGWLPMGENLQIDIFERLQKGQTVYARVNRIYDLDLYPGKKGLIIDVARYATR